jgi:hypothetical protein
MPAIERLLKRWGYVKLDRFGLALTPEDRVLSMRPAVLDGVHGRIVGWRDSDLAAMELTRPEAVVIPPTLPAPVVAPRVEEPNAALASEAEPPEDDWEWEIALARARIAAEEVDAATPPPRGRRGDTVPPPVTPSVVVIPAKTEPIVVVTAPKKTEPIPAVNADESVHLLTPTTRIPVPRLPSLVRDGYRPEPFVRVGPPPIPPRRLAKGTEPVGDKTSPAIAASTRPDVKPRAGVRLPSVKPL